ncbi:T3SS (YopN, CesT) and YbjN peptide-binding chaperone 1 [Nocardioides iriomotensis]|uniref:YbjN domain-containing protein n=1 Tax=Nocardioides iriomotensis TaxID=715784 RepID=A0A4Q5IXS3_9ACTN|nr:YbjN domain-containing protein [Nocardioides iriomotensis]RYU09695.1 hypothetical protein ETU37_21985 [Nocardioides iriomotensis]
MSVFWTLDGAGDDAWAAFRRRLADHVAAMADHDILVVEAERGEDVPFADDLGGAEPYVQFLGHGDGRVHAEVSSNAWLRPGRLLDAASVDALVALGWTAPGDEDDANFTEDAPTGEADRLAVMAVAALRDVFGVPHPAFLLAEGLEVERGATRYVEHDPDDVPATGDEPTATRPADRDELVALVDGALTPVFGHEPHRDDDGDIPVTAGTATVFVRVRDDMPVVEIFCRVVHGIEDHDAALFEVNELNNEHRLISFAVVGDAVMAEILVPALPFAPAHLRDMLEVMCGTVDRVAPALARRVGGGVEREPEAEADPELEPDDGLTDDVLLDEDVLADLFDLAPPEPEAVRLLRQLDLDAPGTLTPSLVAEVCDWDRSTVLAVIEWCEASEDDEAAAWLRLLRRTLRHVLERQAARRTGDRPRRHRQPDVTLPGLDDVSPEGPGLFGAGTTWSEGGRA